MQSGLSFEEQIRSLNDSLETAKSHPGYEKDLALLNAARMASGYAKEQSLIVEKTASATKDLATPAVYLIRDAADNSSKLMDISLKFQRAATKGPGGGGGATPALIMTAHRQNVDDLNALEKNLRERLVVNIAGANATDESKALAGRKADEMMLSGNYGTASDPVTHSLIKTRKKLVDANKGYGVAFEKKTNIGLPGYPGSVELTGDKQAVTAAAKAANPMPARTPDNERDLRYYMSKLYKTDPLTGRQVLDPGVLASIRRIDPGFQPPKR
jgi:hypothetical protein